MLPPQHLDDLERLAWYQAARAREEERRRIEEIEKHQGPGDEEQSSAIIDRHHKERSGQTLDYTTLTQRYHNL